VQIKRLKLTGFKSFVDPAELRIERGLTGVVGPNGCGKSNLLEAIRWVMGEGSAKSLRGGAMDDVIFAGTASRPSRDFAEVSLLAETDAANDISDRGREMEVVRRIERGAGSAYRIDGRDVRAKDVALIFADAATGAHSPALVSQGKISAVISAKPTDRRAMLEEAAGISGLHVRRKDAEQKLRATETNLNKLSDVLADMEVRTGALRRQARAAERYRKLSTDIRVAEGQLIFARWRDAAAAADIAKAEAQAAEEAVQKAAEAQRAAAAYQTQAVKALAERRSAALSAREKANEAGHSLAGLRTERSALDRRIAELAAQTQQLAADHEREGQLARDAAEALTRLAAEAKMLEARIIAAEQGRPALVDRQAAAQAATRDAEVALAQALTAQAREQAESRVADAALAAAATRLDRATRDKARLDQDVMALGDETPLITTRDAAAQKRETSEAAAKQAAHVIEQAEATRRAAAQARDTAESEGSTAQAALAALESEGRALAKAVETGSGGNRALALIKAAKGYEVALAAALGDDLDAEVGGTGSRNWTGADQRSEDPPLPKGAEPLARYVDAPAALARRLAQVGVVSSDDGSVLMAGQRIVSLDGRLRRWDGYVATGQGAAAAERLIRINRLAEIEAELPAARSAVDNARTAMANAQATAEDARRDAEAARRALADAESAARIAARDEDQASVALERLASRRAELAERVTRINEELAEAHKDAVNAEAAKHALPDGVSTAQSVTKLQAASEGARAVVAQIQAEAASLDRNIAADSERKVSADAEARNWKSRAGEAANRIADMEKRARAADAEAETLKTRPEVLDGKIAALETESVALFEAAESAAVAEREGEAQLRTIEAQLSQLGEAMATARETRAGAIARAENQELRRIEMGRVSGERFECPPPLLPEKVGFDEADVRDASTESAAHERLMADRERIGPVNLIAEQELTELEAEREKSMVERDELTEAVNRLRGSIGSLNREGRARLLDAFEKVNTHFQRLFATLFNGGQAHLALIDSDDPLEAGLEIFAQPPGKRLQSLTLLSGGEQALTAVALIFGLFLTNPAPICVLDEVDAPLDDANIERFCNLLDTMTHETSTRYLIVTHNAVTMSRMHRLFGVTMIEQGVSRLVSVDLGGAEALLAAE
jgi:chromosome segregation protein